ncbi:MAG TPA: hypothetical protein PLC07_01015 [Bacillota bacterium]|nr:hypothetical protein [Bacillota bacterium]
MTRKAAAILLVFCLILSFGMATWAKDKTVYVEYSKEEGKDDYYPKVGFDWRINYYWGFAANHQFEVGGDSEAKTYMEVRRLFIDQQLALIFNGETSESYDSFGIKVNAYFPLNDLVSYNWALIYNTYFGKRHNNPYALDYHALKAFGELRYKINNRLTALINGEWRMYQYDIKDATNTDPDYSEMQVSTGLGCQIKENFYIEGVYNWTDTRYDDPGINKKFGNGFIFKGNYAYKKRTFYVKYPFSQNDRTSVVGVSYTF